MEQCGEEEGCWESILAHTFLSSSARALACASCYAIWGIVVVLIGLKVSAPPAAVTLRGIWTKDNLHLSSNAPMLSTPRLIYCVRPVLERCRASAVHTNRPITNVSLRATNRTALPYANKVMHTGDNASAQTTSASRQTHTASNNGLGSTESLAEECARVHEQVFAFLARAPRTTRVEQAQKQTRESLAIIDEALRRYR